MVTPLLASPQTTPLPVPPVANFGWYLPVPVVCTTADATIQWCNQAFADLTHTTPSDLLGYSFLHFFSPRHADKIIRHMRVLEHMTHFQRHMSVQMQTPPKTGQWVILRSRQQIVDGQVCWIHTIHPTEDTVENATAPPFSQSEFLSERFVQGWVRVLHARDLETSVHTQRVADMTVAIGAVLGVSATALRAWRWGALLHDIGKIAIPDSILHKPGKLTEEEWVIMRRHPLLAQSVIQEVTFLPQEVLEIPLYHHERCDGSGYPFGLYREQIPLSARAFAIIDVWDALSQERPYRKAWAPRRIWAYLHSESGRLFDPQVLQTFEQIYRQGRLNTVAPSLQPVHK